MNKSGTKYLDKLALVQFFAFKVYRAMNILGLFKISKIDEFFVKLYFLYKNKLEAISPSKLKPFIPKDGVVLDIGAAMGFYTIAIAEYLTEGGKVFAIEPEIVNFSRLKRILEKKDLTKKVNIIQCAVSSITGEVYLSIDKNNPANHKIDEDGVRISAISVDDLCKDFLRCDFIKIDVQGFEGQVLKGARKTIVNFAPTILLEIDNTFDTHTTSEVLEFFLTLSKVQYSFWTLSNEISPITEREIISRKGYFDLLLTTNRSEA